MIKPSALGLRGLYKKHPSIILFFINKKVIFLIDLLLINTYLLLIGYKAY